MEAQAGPRAQKAVPTFGAQKAARAGIQFDFQILSKSLRFVLFPVLIQIVGAQQIFPKS